MSSRFEREAQRRRSRALNHLARRRRSESQSFWRDTSRKGRNTWQKLELPLSQAHLRILMAGASLALGLVLGTGAWWQISDALRDAPATLKQMQIRGASRLDAREIAQATGIAPGAVLATVDPAILVERLGEHDWIASARALRVPGGTLLVAVVERVPRAVVAAGVPPLPFAVDASGVPFAPLNPDESGLPRLRGAGGVKARVADPRLARAVALAARLSDFGFAAPEEIGVPALEASEASGQSGASDGFTLRLRSLPTRFVLGDEEPEAKVERLVEVVARHSGEVVRAARVDLRFQDQAVLSPPPTRKGSGTAAPRGDAAPSRQRRSG